MTQHLGTARHRNKKQAAVDLLPEVSGNSERVNVNPEESESQNSGRIAQKKFTNDLCEAFLAANIPFNKLSNVVFKQFLNNYTGMAVPDQSTIRKYYVQRVYDDKMEELRKKAEGQKIWVSLDETTDIDQRHVVCFAFGLLGVDGERCKSYLANVQILDRVNHSTISGFFHDSLRCIWPQQVNYNNVLIVTTDAASYMKKAINALQITYPKMIHMTCLAHALHRVAELVRVNYPAINALISSVKNVFVRSPNRIDTFRELCPDTALPPSPVVTRWGSWIAAATYLATNYDKIYEVISKFDRSQAQSIEDSQVLLENVETPTTLSFISATFSILPKSIKKLEVAGLPLSSAIEIIDSVEDSLKTSYDRTYINKLDDVIKKNTGFASLKYISSVLKGDSSITAPDKLPKNLTPCDMACYKYAPVVSCEVERIFSVYKTVLADNRRSFAFENLKKVLVVKCNS